ncbi:MAG TPA: hypothetical protein VE326_00540 [Candidatus Binatia bacterium]|nr:hypothetical protein [Candidatus Binatia bacterium]
MNGAPATLYGDGPPPTPGAPDRLPSLWFGVLAGPVAWAIQLPLVYALAVWSCDHVGMATLHVVSILCFAAALAGGFSARRNLRLVRDPAGASAETRRIMALLGLMTSSLFGLVVLASWFAVFLLSPCPA